MEMQSKRVLHILWTNADVDTAQYMVMMYATNSMLNGWWDDVTVILWGATVKLTAENAIVQERIRIAAQAGVKFSACVSCAEQLGVKEQITALGIEVIPWGKPLTDLLQSGQPLLTV